MAHYFYFIKNVENYQHFKRINMNSQSTLKDKINKFFIGHFVNFMLKLSLDN